MKKLGNVRIVVRLISLFFLKVSSGTFNHTSLANELVNKNNSLNSSGIWDFPLKILCVGAFIVGITRNKNNSVRVKERDSKYISKKYVKRVIWFINHKSYNALFLNLKSYSNIEKKRSRTALTIVVISFPMG